MTDPLKKIELFKAIASPAYIISSLENSNEGTYRKNLNLKL